MTLRMQGLLLRFLETGEIQKVGAERVAMAPNVRVIAATNRNLRDLIAQGQFREDLFYRLNVIHLVVPPLRERREDIPALIEHFLRQLHQRELTAYERQWQWKRQRQRQRHANVTSSEAIAPEAVAVLCEYAWPGNVRELENVIERLVVTGRREMIGVDDLPIEIRTPLQIGMRPRARAPADGRRRSVQEARRGTRVVLDGGVSAVHEPRDHARQRPRPGAQGPRRSARQLQDRAEAVQHGIARLQAVPELPAEARLPASVQRVPAVDADVRRFFGLRERPFDLLPNPRFLYLDGPAARGVQQPALRPDARRAGLTLLIGEAGTGKTTLVQSVLAELDRDRRRVRAAQQPDADAREFYEFLATGFGLDAERGRVEDAIPVRAPAASPGRDTPRPAQRADPRRSAEPSLRAARGSAAPQQHRDGDGQAAERRAGRPARAGARLNEPGLRQLKQRISLRVRAEAFEFPETAAYIAGRLRIAGGDPADLHPRSRSCDSRGVARRAADGQRDLRQRADRRLRRAGQAGDASDRRRGLPRLRCSSRVFDRSSQGTSETETVPRSGDLDASNATADVDESEVRSFDAENDFRFSEEFDHD